MAETLFTSRQMYYPYWTNVPPKVPKNVFPLPMFRRDAEDKYTRREGTQSSQRWDDRWYDFGRPVLRREELPKHSDTHEPCSQPWQYQPGTCDVLRWSRAGKDWPVSDRYLRNDTTNSECLRHRSISRISRTDRNLYPFTNYMTSTYRKPVYSVYGPLQKNSTLVSQYGLTHQHNQHGFMPSEDYY